MNINLLDIPRAYTGIAEWMACMIYAIRFKPRIPMKWYIPVPGPDCAIGLVKAVRENRVSEKQLDQRLKELLKVVFSTSEAVNQAPKTFDQDHRLRRGPGRHCLLYRLHDRHGHRRGHQLLHPAGLGVPQQG